MNPEKNISPFSPRILLVDDEQGTLLSFSTLLKSHSLRNVVCIEDSRKVLPFLEKHHTRLQPVALVILDLSMPFLPGQDLLLEIREQYPDITIIVMTATNEIDTAVECMKNGAIDYLVKPVETNRFLSSVRHALETRQLKEEVLHLSRHILSDTLENPHVFSSIITQDSKMTAIFRYIEAICRSNQPVLITGETGVGKELIARALHNCGRQTREFIAVNVAGLDDSMFTDTLFGHKKGAFTGADSSREGLIAQAAGGTLFLDEIGDLNPQSQVKLLRLIQEYEYYPLGSDLPRKTDTRVITATNRDLKQLMETGNFRRDLYYRLCSHHIHVPSLRERKGDIPLLARHFLSIAAHKLHKKEPTIPLNFNELLAAYHFPGNIRELESLVYDAVSLYRGGSLSLEGFRQVMQSSHPDVLESKPQKSHGNPGDNPLEDLFGKFPTLKQMDNFLIDEAMKKAGGNQGTAASYLGITRQALNKRLNRAK